MTRRSFALGVLGGLVLLLLALQTPLLATARGASWTVLTATVGRLARVGPLSLEPSVQDQLAELQLENLRLKAELADYQALREELGSHSFESLRSINALVVGRPITTFRSELVINRGAKHGVVPGSPVIIKGGELIGFVATLHERTAVVELLLNPAVTTNAQVLDVERANGLVRGRSHTALILTTIPRDAAIEPEQEVVTVAEDGIPAGLRLGTIRSVTDEANQAYQEALLELSYDPDRIRAVQILVAP